MNSRTLRAASLSAAAAAAITAGALPAGASAATTKTYKGKQELTQYGDVQVTIAVRSKKIKSISIGANPDSQESYQRQSYALPILRTEALKVDSYKIHTVSGVTISSEAFMASLYSAMHHAHLV